jgi:hypothetical protein
MVAVVPIRDIDMHGDSSVQGESPKKLVNELGLELPYPLAQLGHIVNQVRPIGQVNCHRRQGLIHGNQLLSVAPNRLPLAQSLGESLSQADTYVFHRMVLIHPKITLGLQFQIEATMGCQ